MSRTPVRATAIREEAPPKKTRIRKNAAARSLLDIPADIVNGLKEQGIDLQWVTDSVLGQSTPQNRMAFEINAWEAVTPDMFDGVFDGMFTRKGHKGEINYEGLVLMWRPLELTEEAQAEERAARNSAIEAQQNMIKGGVIPGLSAGFEADHPTAISRNKFRRSVEAMEIPRD